MPSFINSNENVDCFHKSTIPIKFSNLRSWKTPHCINLTSCFNYIKSQPSRVSISKKIYIYLLVESYFQNPIEYMQDKAFFMIQKMIRPSLESKPGPTHCWWTTVMAICTYMHSTLKDSDWYCSLKSTKKATTLKEDKQSLTG